MMTDTDVLLEPVFQVAVEQHRTMLAALELSRRYAGDPELLTSQDLRGQAEDQIVRNLEVLAVVDRLLVDLEWQAHDRTH